MGIFKDLARELTQEARECLSYKEVRSRRPYKRGAQEFLLSMEVGKMIEFVDDDKLNYRGMQAVAARLRNDLGVRFEFRTKRDKRRFITRVA